MIIYLGGGADSLVVPEYQYKRLAVMHVPSQGEKGLLWWQLCADDARLQGRPQVGGIWTGGLLQQAKLREGEQAEGSR